MHMQAVRIHAYGTPEVMQLETLSIPTPGSGQALVRVEAASVNFLDIQHRRGDLVKQAFYQQKAGLKMTLPTIIGSQGIGTVESFGPDTANPRVHTGSRVAFFGSSYATHAVVPAAHLIPVPDGISLEEAAAGLNQGFLAYAFTHHTYPVKQGDWCLVQAAAGGLGHLICQIAKLRGGRVIGVTSSAEKADMVKAMGADEVILSQQADIAKEVQRITEGKGVHVVYDGVGKDTFEANLDSLTPGGYLVIYGQSSGYVPPFDLMRLQEKGSLFITRTNGLPYTHEYPTYLQQFATWLKEGKLSIRIDHTYALADAAKAHKAVEQRRSSGRILLLP
ncbi:quinone oxidoreductase family protein [Alicyclobacillus fodiniaquatilis]|uniref:Quinone oxidoreductase family protein n=1 Tax=Alicyclobacillus fodiniaquatilis TaxID=1661150 RepID=A0ABW4JMV5_9BACL